MKPRATLVFLAFAVVLVADHYPAWALYSGNRSPAVQEYVTDEGPDRDWLDVAEWSYGELDVPAYPEVRVFRRVQRALCRYGKVTLVIEPKRTLFGGERRRIFTCAAESYSVPTG